MLQKLKEERRLREIEKKKQRDEERKRRIEKERREAEENKLKSGSKSSMAEGVCEDINDKIINQ